MPASPAFSDEEFAALENTQFFEAKTAATARMKGVFEELREALRPELPPNGWLCAGAVDTARGQLTTGEDYLGLPYVVLDFPKCFSREEFLTMRTLFWWGHYVAYALIMQGAWLAAAVERVAESLAELEAAGVEATVAEDPWDWRRGAGFTRPLRADDATAAWLREAPFLKLMRFVPLERAAFTPERIVGAGVETWRLYAPLVRTSV